MRGRKHSHSKTSRIGKNKRNIRRNLGNTIKRIPPRNTPDGKTPCEGYVKDNCILYSGKELRRICPNGHGYIREKNQNPNNWSTCDYYNPYKEKKKDD
jgi:hypothetical protein